MGADDLEYHKEDYDYESLSLQDKCLVHRYLIFAVNHPVISKEDYDVMVSNAIQTGDLSHSIFDTGGFEIKERYPVEIRTIATELTHQKK